MSFELCHCATARVIYGVTNISLFGEGRWQPSRVSSKDQKEVIEQQTAEQKIVKNKEKLAKAPKKQDVEADEGKVGIKVHQDIKIARQR